MGLKPQNASNPQTKEEGKLQWHLKGGRQHSSLGGTQHSVAAQPQQPSLLLSFMLQQDTPSHLLSFAQSELPVWYGVLSLCWEDTEIWFATLLLLEQMILLKYVCCWCNPNSFLTNTKRHFHLKSTLVKRIPSSRLVVASPLQKHFSRKMKLFTSNLSSWLQPC